MLKISRLSDYAIVLLTALASDSETEPGQHRANARALAERTGINMPTVGKLLKLLHGQGIVHSRQGRSGGYFLARPAEAISLAEIIEAIDGPIAMTDCFRPDHDCAMEGDCAVRPHWEAINRGVHALLDATSLADMSRPVECPEAPDKVPVWYERSTDGRQVAGKVPSGRGRTAT
ncbi:MAG: SUF system Fe-S cluster assembly regulator [Guyparkeria sp.]|uniref:SUF system Fe-S cluster assembly regulator n=1 Tax=Guyparkeria sp. TaxID=2035736 RepID=UPI00397BD444